MHQSTCYWILYAKVVRVQDVIGNDLEPMRGTLVNVVDILVITFVFVLAPSIVWLLCACNGDPKHMRTLSAKFSTCIHCHSYSLVE